MSIGLVKFLANPLPTSEHPLCFYSSETRDDLKKIFSTSLRTAKTSLALSSYGYSDQDILSLLHQKESEGIVISFCQKHGKKTKGLHHRKFFIIDQAILCLSSVNLTEPSLTVHNNLALLILHPILASHILSFSPYEDDAISYYPLPDCGKEALGAIISALDGAHSSIELAIFTLTHPKLIDALIRASQRGVHVEVFLDKQNAKAASKWAFETLCKAGIPIHCNIGRQLFHHKCARIDKTILLFGSANWTKAAFESNDEDFLIFHHLSKEHQKFFDRFFSSIRYT